MTTLEPLTEAELNELQAQWMNGNRERRQYRREISQEEGVFCVFCATPEPLRPGMPHSASCPKRLPQPLFETSVNGKPVSMTYDDDSVRHYGSHPLAEDWTRHTVDITRQPMSVEDEPIAYARPWKWLAALAVVAVFYGACWLVGRWWVQK